METAEEIDRILGDGTQAILEWGDWCNKRRLFEALGDITAGRGRIDLLRHHDAVRELSNGRQTLQ